MKQKKQVDFDVIDVRVYGSPDCSAADEEKLDAVSSLT